MQKTIFLLLTACYLFSCSPKPKQNTSTTQTDTTQMVAKLQDSLSKVAQIAEQEEQKKQEEAKIAEQEEQKKQEESKMKLPKVQSLKLFPKTTFIQTLESPLQKNKNQIYTASLGYAWEKMRKTLKDSIQIRDTYTALKQLNKSKSYKGSLDKKEVKTEVKISGDIIEVMAYFRKSLRFLYPFGANTEITFGEKVVKAFRMGSEHDNMKIRYYKDDEHFVVQLLCKDSEQEIILAKGITELPTFAERIAMLNKIMALGAKESKWEANQWKYEYNSSWDRFLVPCLSFNVENREKTLEGSKFFVNKEEYDLIKAYLQVAVVLNENGMEMESKSEISVKGATKAVKEVEEKPKPKKLIFDKPFLLIAKRKEAANPYLALWINNTELMQLAGKEGK